MIIVIFLLVAIGAPAGFSIKAASIVCHLGMTGLALVLAGEKILQGLYNSFVILTIPLFVAAANIMNVGTISKRLLKFCIAIVGRFRGEVRSCKCFSVNNIFRNVKISIC